MKNTIVAINRKEFNIVFRISVYIFFSSDQNSSTDEVSHWRRSDTHERSYTQHYS